MPAFDDRAVCDEIWFDFQVRHVLRKTITNQAHPKTRILKDCINKYMTKTLVTSTDHHMPGAHKQTPDNV